MSSPVLEDFRNPEIARKLLARIGERVTKKTRIMEVCGTHTMAISRYGIRKSVPPDLTFLSGPGCPVCVTPTSMVDLAIEISRREDSILLTFGDMMRVPGSKSTLEKEKAQGRDIRVVYSPYDGLDIARSSMRKLVVFVGVGFETTVPAFAATVKKAREEDIENFCVLPCFKLIPPAIRAILSSGDVRVDGFILPGHVSAIIGTAEYGFISSEYGIPCVVAGFEPLDVLHAVTLLLEQNARSPTVTIAYTRGVRPEGNRVARSVMDEVFSPSPSEWRGLGEIDGSGLSFREDYAEFDAVDRIGLTPAPAKDPETCICGAILKGTRLPADCPLFGRSCSPSTPVGPCMVSSEGACAAYYRYDLNPGR